MARPPLLLRTVLGATLGMASVSLLALPEADARASFDSAYTLEQTYNAALRFVRVDQGFKVTEKDPAAAYVMFDYRSAESGDRVTPGSIEVIPSGQTVKVIVQLSQMPRYHEQVLADGLARKLRTEYGEPVKKQPPAAPDGGADASPE